MNLSLQQRRYLLHEQVLLPIAINVAFNAAATWLAFTHFAPVPMWTLPGVALDLLSTLPALPFIISVLTTPMVKAGVRKGRLTPLELGPEAYPLLRLLPAGELRRATVLGLLSLIVCGPPIASGLLALGDDQMELWSFVCFKSLLCGALAAVISPVAALYTLAQTSRATPTVQATLLPEADRTLPSAPQL